MTEIKQKRKLLTPRTKNVFGLCILRVISHIISDIISDSLFSLSCTGWWRPCIFGVICNVENVFYSMFEYVVFHLLDFRHNLQAVAIRIQTYRFEALFEYM